MKKDKRIYSCTIEDLSENYSATRELLETLCENLVSVSDIEDGIKFHVAYFDTEDEARAFAKDALSLQDKLKTCGMKLSPAKIEMLSNEDWTNAWKKYFTVMKISGRIVVKPSWLEYSRQNDNEIILDIDPGMSFGTGKHPTTQFCLQLIEKNRKYEQKRQSLIDIGCGSGILALAALKLGYAPVLAVDNDPEALETSRQNFAKNNISNENYRIFVANLADFYTKDKFDVVVANILSIPLVEGRFRIVDLLSDKGIVILSGILENEYDNLKAKYEEIGFVQIEKLSDGNWLAASFQHYR